LIETGQQYVPQRAVWHADVFVDVGEIRIVYIQQYETDGA